MKFGLVVKRLQDNSWRRNWKIRRRRRRRGSGSRISNLWTDIDSR
jgi:hypothetical protein